jgi:hypothetical protein
LRPIRLKPVPDARVITPAQPSTARTGDSVRTRPLRPGCRQTAHSRQAHGMDQAEEGPPTWAFTNGGWWSRGICPVHTEEVRGRPAW